MKTFITFILVLIVSSCLSLPWENNLIDGAVNEIMKDGRQSKSVFTNIASMMMNRTQNIFNKNKNKNIDCSKCFPGQGGNSICDTPTSPIVTPGPNGGLIAWRDVLHCAPGGVFYGSECIYNCQKLCNPNLPAPTMCGDHLVDPQSEGLQVCVMPAISGSCSGDILFGPITPAP